MVEWCPERPDYYRKPSQRKGYLSWDWRMSRGFQWRRQGRVKCVVAFPGGSVQFSRSVVSSSLRPRGLQHAGPPCPSPTPGVYSDSYPLSWWYHPTISSFVILFSSRLQSFPASGSLPVSQFFPSGGLSIGSFSFSISPSSEYSGLISFRMDWLDLLDAQGTLKSLLQHHSSKALILQRSTFFMVQLSDMLKLGELSIPELWF